MHLIDTVLNRITMYKLVLYGLAALAAASFALSLTGILSYGALNLAASLVTLLIVCRVMNGVLVRVFRASANVESSWITALILFLVVAPPSSGLDIALIALTGALAIASKFYLSFGRRHVFNPAAIALVIMSAAGSGIASWWVGAPALLPFSLVLGLLVVRKIRRFDLFWWFLATVIAVAAAGSIFAGAGFISTVSALAYSGPLVFFGTIMLTEPLTMPPTRELRIVFGMIVGAFFASQFNFLGVFATPQLALIVGNLYAYAVNSKQRIRLALERVERLSDTVYEFVFNPSERLAFAAGQYMEWTLPHARPDFRGNRRYFTIASSPGESQVRLGVRIDDNPSSFKRALSSLVSGGEITASGLSGDFTLPKDATRKLAFVAGGVGITPFASMLRSLLSRNERRDIVLFYAVSSEHDIAYRALIARAREILGIKVVLLAGERLDAAMLERAAPDLRERLFFLSGPNAMVENYKRMLLGSGVGRSAIKTDYFPGL